MNDINNESLNVLTNKPSFWNKLPNLPRKKIASIGVVAFLAVFLLVAVQNIGNPLRFFSNAAEGVATVELQPITSFLPPEKEYNAWVILDSKASFIRLSFTFDTAKLRLTKDPLIILPGFNKISSTTAVEANSTGTIILVAGLDPAQLANAPTGALKFANISFDSKTTATNATAQVHVNVADSQVVNTLSSSLTVAGNDLLITVNPTATPVPTASPLATRPPTAPPAAAGPTKSPSPSPMRTPSPMPTPVKSPTPLPTANAKTPPPPSPVVSTPSPTPIVSGENSVPVIATRFLNRAILRFRYFSVIVVNDANPNETITMFATDLPPGLTLGECKKTGTSSSTFNCPIQGSARVSGTYYPTFTATDARGARAITTLKLSVVSFNEFFRSYFRRF